MDALAFKFRFYGVSRRSYVWNNGIIPSVYSNHYLSRKEGGRLLKAIAFGNDKKTSETSILMFVAAILATGRGSGQRYINITRNAIGLKSGQKDFRKF